MFILILFAVSAILTMIVCLMIKLGLIDKQKSYEYRKESDQRFINNRRNGYDWY